jgi:aspartate/methionine/tyrosine aminotransferase
VVCVASAGYPCYRNILEALSCDVVTIPINEQFKVTTKELEVVANQVKASGKRIKGLILSSPSNPTGAMLTPAELKGAPFTFSCG